MNSIQSNLRTINCVNFQSVSKVKSFLSQRGFYIFELDGEHVKDAQSFFREAVNLFPQDPQLSGSVNWDAFLDSLWGGLDKLGKGRVAFIWTKVEKMLVHGLPDLLVAVECFSQLASDVNNTETGITCRVELLVFLIGEGDNFKPFYIEG